MIKYAKDFYIPPTLKINVHENIEIVLRKYWVSLIYKLSLGLVLFVAPFFFIVPLFKIEPWGMVIFVVVVTLALFIVFRVLWVWYTDVFVITNNRTN